jgi:hypothetical protein
MVNEKINMTIYETLYCFRREENKKGQNRLLFPYAVPEYRR